MNQSQDTLPAGTRPRSRVRDILFVLIGVGLLVGGLVPLVVLLDPFGWRILDRLGGTYDATIEAIPPDSVLYVGVNALNSNPTRLVAIQDAFARAFVDADYEGARADLDQELQRELGVSLTDDVLPWAGQFYGGAILEVTQDLTGAVSQTEWVLVAESRRNSAADRFLEKLAVGWAARYGLVAAEERYEGVTIVGLAADRPAERLALARSGRLVLMGSTPAAVKSAIDAQMGASLRDQPAFVRAVRLLPPGRLGTAFLNGADVDRLLAPLIPAVPVLPMADVPDTAVSGVALGLTVAEPGLVLDLVVDFNAERLSEQRQQALTTSLVGPQIAGLVPADTLLFLSGYGLDRAWPAYRQAFLDATGDADFSEALALLGQQFGLDPDADLFPYLDGEAGLGLVAADDRLPALLGQPGLGLMLVVDASQESTLTANLAAFSDGISVPLFGPAQVTEDSSVEGVTLYGLETFLLPGAQLAYGVTPDHFVLGTSLNTLQRLRFGGEDSLADRPDYQALWPLFPVEMVPFLYVDVAGIIPILREQAVPAEQQANRLALLEPISTIAAASEVQGSSVHAAFILFVETG